MGIEAVLQPFRALGREGPIAAELTIGANGFLDILKLRADKRRFVERYHRRTFLRMVNIYYHAAFVNTSLVYRALVSYFN